MFFLPYNWIDQIGVGLKKAKKARWGNTKITQSNQHRLGLGGWVRRGWGHGNLTLEGQIPSGVSSCGAQQSCLEEH